MVKCEHCGTAFLSRYFDETCPDCGTSISIEQKEKMKLKRVENEVDRALAEKKVGSFVNKYIYVCDKHGLIKKTDVVEIRYGSSKIETLRYYSEPENPYKFSMPFWISTRCKKCKEKSGLYSGPLYSIFRRGSSNYFGESQKKLQTQYERLLKSGNIEEYLH